MNIENKREREKLLVCQMIALYCRKNHGGKALCADCRGLSEYACLRSDKCPFMENKTFCSNCRIHCYKPEMREKIRAVMRFSGPRMMFHHPITAIRHVIEVKREKNRQEKGNCTMKLKKVIYITVGCIGLALGAVGAVLPLMSAFPFLLLAAVCFGKSSERFAPMSIKSIN